MALASGDGIPRHSYDWTARSVRRHELGRPTTDAAIMTCREAKTPVYRTLYLPEVVRTMIALAMQRSDASTAARLVVWVTSAGTGVNLLNSSNSPYRNTTTISTPQTAPTIIQQLSALTAGPSAIQLPSSADSPYHNRTIITINWQPPP